MPHRCAISWNTSHPESTAKLRKMRGDLTFESNFLSDFATKPFLTSMELILDLSSILNGEDRIRVLPSRSSIHGVITVGDILKAVYRYLQRPLSSKELAYLSKVRSPKLLEAYQKMGNFRIPPSIRLIDCMEKTMFGGLERPAKGRGDVWRVVLCSQ